MTFLRRITEKKALMLSLSLFFFVIGFAGCSGTNEDKSENLQSSDQPSQQVKVVEADVGSLKELQASFRTVSQKVLPVVVEINVVEVIRQTIPRISPWEFFFNPFGQQTPEGEEREFRKQGLGSGVIVRKNGDKVYVLTNSHVVGTAEEISVRLYDGREFKAKLVGKDQRMDLALVSFETKEDIPLAVLGDSDNLQIGDWVLAIGNPMGFESTVTAGIVSALGRRQQAPGMQVGYFTDYIQTDAAINPGNSGGALVNLDGEVIGINTWIASQSGGFQGLGFAIPINNAKAVIDDFIRKGRVEYGWLGVQIMDLTAQAALEIAKDLKLKDENGAFVAHIFKNSPADKGGVKPGDYIVEVNGEDVRNSVHRTRLVGFMKPGDRAEFVVIRYGKRERLTVTLAERKPEEQIQEYTAEIWPGIFPVKIDDNIRNQLKLDRRTEGVVIATVVSGSRAEVAGFRQGDVVLKIDNREIKNTMDFYKALGEASGR